MDLAGFSESNMASSSRIQSVGPRPGFSTLHRLRKKRKGQRVKDPLDDLLLKTLTSQRAMEERFLQMEERRLQRDMEVEERRMQLEQRRFELEREHEFRMFNVFAQMLSILKQNNSSSSSSVALPRGLDFIQVLSDITGMGGGGGGLQDARAMQLGRPLSERRTDMHSFCNPGEFQGSPFLSARGNIANIFRGTTEEGYKAYHADKYDEDKNPNGIINFGTSENKLCFDLMSKRLTQSDMNIMEPPLLQYPDWKGHMFLREEVARFLTYYCKAPAPLKAENVIVLNGCGSLFSALATVLCDPGEAVLIATPFYGGITQSVFLYGNIKLVYAYLDSKITGTSTRPFQLTVDKLEKALQDARSEGISVKALILLNPQNPLGDLYSLSELWDYLEFAKRHELHVIVDEIYMLSVFDESATFHSVLGMDRLPDPQRTHVMWGISKDFAVSGIRFGTLYTENQDVANAVASLCYFHGVCGPVQHKVAQLLRDRDWINQVYLRANHARLKAAHTYVTDELKTLGVPFLNRNAGFFVWIDFRKYLRTGTFEEEVLLWRRFLDNKVLLSCGKAFECSEPGWFRIIFADKTHRLQLGESYFLLSISRSCLQLWPTHSLLKLASISSFSFTPRNQVHLDLIRVGGFLCFCCDPYFFWFFFLFLSTFQACSGSVESWKSESVKSCLRTRTTPASQIRMAKQTVQMRSSLYPITRSLVLLVAPTSVTSLASCSSRCAPLTGCRRTQWSSLHRRSQKSMTCSANWWGNNRDSCSSMGLI
uniref:Aminotransferase class I/classII large domain-containing protein n=1 Tax=Pelusios castaneus TaxID=367368 RepID=A0A8C8RR89_9SAUR